MRDWPRILRSQQVVFFLPVCDPELAVPHGPRVVRVAEREDGLDVPGVQPVWSLFEVPTRDACEPVLGQNVGAAEAEDGKDEGDAAADGLPAVEDRLLAHKQLLLIVDPPRHDRAAVEVDRAGGVVASVQHNDGAGHGEAEQPRGAKNWRRR